MTGREVPAMTRRKLAAKVAQRAGISRRAADRAIRAFLEAVVDELRCGRSVELVGFGRFGVRRASARTGRNIKTGKPVRIPAGWKPFFRSGKGLKTAVAGRRRSK